MTVVSHFFEQVLRFTKVPWEELSPERRDQLCFNIGTIVGSLNLRKEDGYNIMVSLREGKIDHLQANQYFEFLADKHKLILDYDNIDRDI